MKKLFLLFILLLPFTAWGQTVGISMFGGFKSGGYENSTVFMDKEMGVSMPLSYTDGGFSIFFDIEYLEASIGYLYAEGFNNYMFVSSPIIQIDNIGNNFDFSALTFGLLAKYPFERPLCKLLFGNAPFDFRLAPLLGIDIVAAFDVLLDDIEVIKPFHWSQYWLKFGLDWEIRIVSRHSIRLGFLYGFRLPTIAERNLAEDTKQQLEQSFKNNFDRTPNIRSRTMLGHGAVFRMAYGFKFN